MGYTGNRFAIRFEPVRAGPLPALMPLRRIGPLLPDRFSAAGEAIGVYRVWDTSIEGYELHLGTDGAPDAESAAWETFAALPHTTAALAAGHVHQLLLRYRNRYNLVSQNINAEEFDVDDDGSLRATPPSDPTDVTLTAAAGGAVRVTGSYAYAADGDNAADAFVIYLVAGGADPDPATDPEIEVAMVKRDGVAKLDYTSATYAHGTLVKAIVRTRRSGALAVDSTNSTVYSVTTSTAGPATPTPASIFLGTAAEQCQG